MEFKPLDQAIADRIYDMYASNAEPVYFRHIPAGLDKETFQRYISMVCAVAGIHMGDKVIGILSFSVMPVVYNTDVNIFIFPEYRKGGYGVMAMKTVLARLFIVDKVPKVMVHLVRGHSLVDTLTKHGFIVEARLRRNAKVNDKIVDELRLCMDRSFYLKNFVAKKPE